MKMIQSVIKIKKTLRRMKMKRILKRRIGRFRICLEASSATNSGRLGSVPIYSGNPASSIAANIRKKNCLQLRWSSSASHAAQLLFPSRISREKSGLRVGQNYLHYRRVSEDLQPESGGNDQVISKLVESEVQLKTIATKIAKDAFTHAKSDPRRGNKCVIVFVLL